MMQLIGFGGTQYKLNDNDIVGATKFSWFQNKEAIIVPVSRAFIHRNKDNINIIKGNTEELMFPSWPHNRLVLRDNGFSPKGTRQ